MDLSFRATSPMPRSRIGIEQSFLSGGRVTGYFRTLSICELERLAQFHVGSRV